MLSLLLLKRFLTVGVLFSALFISVLMAESSPARMTPEKLHLVISGYADDVSPSNNVISFKYKSVSVYCIWDVNADRMRLVSPIVQVSELTPEHLTVALQANYHTVLDARYAIGDGIIYSAFIHPLSSINKTELESAIRQVATAALTFGNSYSSGELVFPKQSQQSPQGGKEL